MVKATMTGRFKLIYVNKVNLGADAKRHPGKLAVNK